MNVKSFANAIRRSGVALILALCLFGHGFVLLFGSLLGSILQDFLVLLRDPQLQWLLFLCLCIYLIIFTYIKARLLVERVWRFDNPSLWLAAALLIGAIVYAINYPTASQSTQALTLLTGATLGRGVWLWPSRQKRGEIPTSFILYALVLLLLIASLWHTDMNRSFEYRGERRWTSLWDNPNIFGLLMGTGIAVVVGLAISKWQKGQETREKNTPKGKLWRWSMAFLCVVSAIFMGYALFHSYSRGAWVGAFCGLSYLAIQWLRIQNSGTNRRWETENQHLVAENSKANTEGQAGVSCDLCNSWIKQNLFPVFIILISLALLFFWQFRHSKQNFLADRIFSVTNVNDFSWRNRIAAWEGALQITAEHPWLGAGWNQTEPLYEHYYLPPKLDDSAAIRMNDYLILIATLGVPALVCFGIYIWLSLTRNGESAKSGKWETETREMHCPTLDSMSPVTRHLLPQAICRAGAIVLAVGFWFDGGLFNLATTSIFWILLELGTVQLPQKGTKSTNEVS